jgi:PKD domain
MDDADPATDLPVNGGGYLASCQNVGVGAGYSWDPDITVAAGATAGTTTDYNDFYSYGTDDTAPYSWDGATYTTLAEFETASDQGAHDLDDSVEPTLFYTRVEKFGINARLASGSTAIGSANTSAPGQLSSDYDGIAPYNDRGAISFTNGSLIAAVQVTDTSALTVSLDPSGSTGDLPIVGCVVNWGDGGTSSAPDLEVLAHPYATPGTYVVKLTVTDQFGYTASTSVKVETAGSDYTAYGPVRLLDTRSGVGAPAKPVPAGGTIHLQVAGYGGASGIPSDVVAVVLNLTVTNTHGSGFITAYDDGDPDGVPTVSNVNYVAGQTVPNLAIVPVGEDGEVDLTNGGTLAGNVDLIADVTGYFTQSSASGYTPLSPYRLVDTRTGTGAAKGQVGQNDTIHVQVAGTDGGSLPASGITAVALNVTVTNPQGSGFLTVYPDGLALPNASNVNYSQKQTIANSVIVPVASDGMIDITNSGTLAKGTDIVVDVVGYYDPASTSAYVPTEPIRLVDTRSAQWGAGPLANGVDQYLALALGVDENGDLEAGVTALVLNATVTNTKGNGILTVAPDPNSVADYLDGYAVLPTPPNSSSLNWTKGQTVPNLVQASTGTTGIIDFWNLGSPAGTTDLIVDGFGYYQNS